MKMYFVRPLLLWQREKSVGADGAKEDKYHLWLSKQVHTNKYANFKTDAATSLGDGSK